MVTMEKNLRQVLMIAEREGWTVDIDAEANRCELQKYSPAGKDFLISLEATTPDEFLNELKERYQNYDPSEEAYLWLGPDGHGKNGAPYDMKDLYEDMEACEEMMLELIDVLEKEL